MTLLGQRRREGQDRWNVRTRAKVTRPGQVVKRMVDYGIEVLGISQARWKGMGSVTLQSGETVVYSGDDKVHQGEVAIMMSVRAKRALMDWTPISKRINTA